MDKVTVAATGLTVLPAWSEPLHAVVSVGHPLAGRASVSLTELAAGALRVLDDDADPPIHAAVMQALGDAGVCPTRGRTAGSVQDVVVAVGADPTAWALLPAEQVATAGSRRVVSLPLDPLRSVVGAVVAPPTTAPSCARALAAAFADTAEPARTERTARSLA